MKETLFIDADGVVAAFEAKALEILGMPASEYEAIHKAKGLWREIRHYRSSDGLGFFEDLDLMPDAMDLFGAVRHLNPIILTGCPFGDWAPVQKKRWAERHFPGTTMITCMARDKHTFMNPGDVLIDDREKHRAAWEDAGGVWITHTSAESSVAQLRALKPEWF